MFLRSPSYWESTKRAREEFVQLSADSSSTDEAVADAFVRLARVSPNLAIVVRAFDTVAKRRGVVEAITARIKNVDGNWADIIQEKRRHPGRG